MTGIGPVEPCEPTGPPPGPRPRPDTLSTPRSETPRLTERWAAVPVPRRRAALALALATTAATALLLLRPAPATPAPPPWPSQVTALRYDGPGSEPGRFRFTVHVSGASPVTVHRLTTGPARLTADSAPTLPVTVEPGSPWHLTAHLTPHHCASLPHGINEPYIELTLSNRRARQEHAFLFGDSYRRDLWQWIRASCRPSPAPRTIMHGSYTQLPPS
ncbi:hypothetical protein ACFWFB_32565 [Streptomyces albidoflavus]